MRILALRGRNLASLARFDVDFESEPLSGAGLFAITGPTGAGKSTLLDALCLALYDRTPRLSARRAQARVGHAEQDEKDRLGTHDPRLVLRHGAVSGYAEVDFVGCDGHRYRARWEVRRARRRPDGRLQDQVVQLESLDDGHPIGATKTETLAEIERRTGLSFDQFRRSVLLAQGDFAAFLRADKNERADLLERMTGTEIYGRISEISYRRAGEAAARVDSVRSAASEVRALSEDERAALEERRGAAATREQECERALAAAQEACRYWARDRELQVAVEEARAAHEQARLAEDAARARRTENERSVRAQPWREVVATLSEGRSALAGAVAQVEAAGAAEETARGARAAAESELARARTALSDVQERTSALRAPLAQARALEHELAEGERALAERDERRRAADAAAELVAGELRAGEAAFAALRREEAALVARLEESAPLAFLVDDWALWRERLLLAERTAAAASAARAELEELDDALKVAAKRSAELRADEARAHKALREAQAAAEAARERAAELSVDDVRRDLDDVGGELEAIQRSHDLAMAAHRAVADQRAADAEVAAAMAERDRQGRQAAALELDAAAASAAAREAEAALDRLRLVVDGDVSALRGRLIDGDACPVCGSKEHPYRHGDAPGAALLEEQRHRARELRERATDVERERARVGERLAHLSDVSERGRERSRAAAAELQRAQAAWCEQRAGELSAIEDVASEQTLGWLRRRATTLAARRDQLREHERDARSRSAALAEADARVHARQSDAEQARSRLADAQRAALERSRDRAGVAQRAALAEAAATEAWAVTDAARAAARQLGIDAGDDVAQLRARLDEAVARVGEERARLQALRQSLHVDGARLDGIRERMTHLADAAEQARDAWARERAQLDARRRERLEVLGGRTAAEVEDELRCAAGAADAAVTGASDRLAAAETELALAGERRRVAERERDQHLHRRERDEARLAAAARELGIDRGELERLAGRSPEDVAAEGRALSALSDAVTQAAAVVREREQALAAHRASDRPATPAEGASEALARAEDAARAARDDRAAVDARRLEDDAARKRRMELDAELAERIQRADVYASLRELIGSADGRRFRVFAQSLTLESLLGHANRHLGELMDRYRLQRVPGHDLELQVIDRDMGDEVRSIQSLSGGESFMVSLALALGLSSLSARDTRIESLLIDEGFGTLDPDTLDVALSVLDALQASGRKVGLISHVPGLAERVGVRIDVRPRGGGQSDVSVLGA